MEEFEQQTYKKLKVDNVPIQELNMDEMCKFIFQYVLYGCEILPEIAGVIDHIPLNTIDDRFLVDWVFRSIKVDSSNLFMLKLLAHKRSPRDQSNW